MKAIRVRLHNCKYQIRIDCEGIPSRYRMCNPRLTIENNIGLLVKDYIGKEFREVRSTFTIVPITDKWDYLIVFGDTPVTKFGMMG